MSRSRTEYHFKLPRRKRIGGIICRVPLGFIGLGFFGISVFLLFSGVWWAFITGLIALFLAWGFMIALTRYILHKHEDMCLAIDENGIGFGERTPDWWLSADGISVLKSGSDGYWTLHHVNGTCLHFPIGLVSDDDITYLQSTRIHAVT